MVAEIGGGGGADWPGMGGSRLTGLAAVGETTGVGKERGEEGSEICVAGEGYEPRSRIEESSIKSNE